MGIDPHLGSAAEVLWREGQVNGWFGALPYTSFRDMYDKDPMAGEEFLTIVSRVIAEFTVRSR